MFNELKKAILEKADVFTEILGQTKAKDQLKSALLMDRHVLIIGPAGIGKTTLAKNVAKLLPDAVVNDCPYNCDTKNPSCPECKAKKPKTKKIEGEKRFVRIQGSPDLTVEDLIGDIDPIKAMKFGPLSTEAFVPGKIFKANNGVLFFDELNRCPEKLQNALLQVLSEGKATIGSYDVDFETNFIFIATMNPEDASTEKLSDVLMDRFDVIYMSYPETLEIEKDIVVKKSKSIKEISFDSKLIDLMVLFVRLLRESNKLEKFPSVRASIGLYERAQSNALMAKRKNVSWENIADAIVSVISHRIKLKPSFQYLQSNEDFIKDEIKKFSKEKHLDYEEEQGGSL